METTYKPSKNYKADLREGRRKSSKQLLYIGIISIVMLFAGLTSAYVVRADNGNWLLFNLPDMFFVSTALIITSSLTFIVALRAAKKNNYGLVTLGLGLTLVLGVAFCFTQFAGWSELFTKNIVFAGRYSNAAGSFLYVLTGLHMAHLAGGIIALMVTFVKSLRKRYRSEDTLGLELCGIYWHFLDILWVYLFLFLYFIR